MADSYANVPNDPLSQSAYKVFKNTNDPTLEEIIQLLSMRNWMPTITQSYGNSYKPFGNQVSIRPDSVNKNTVSHEMTHALHEAMKKYSSDYKGFQETKSPVGNQFVDAFDKLWSPPEKLLPPKPLSNWEQYRYSPNEASAYGVGNSLQFDPNFQQSRPTPPHLDATLATEQAILRDLFLRATKPKQ